MRFLTALGQDLRHATRLLRLSPGFTLVAPLSLALGIGANSAIFQLLDAVRLRTLPVKNPQELAVVKLTDSQGRRGSVNTPYPALTNPLWERVRDRQQTFSGMFAWATDGFNLATGGESHYAQGLWVSGGFFRVLGVAPVAGRVFAPADDRRGCGTPGAVISYSFWQRQFGGEASAIGRKLTLDSHPVEIVGVTPPGFFGVEVGRTFDVALPICSEAALRKESPLDSGTFWWLTVMGRLPAGRSLAQATAQLNALSPGIFEATLSPRYPRESVKDYLGFKLSAVSAASGLSMLRETYSDPLYFLLAIAGLVLLIACANLANLMLARASAREREISVRLALGASHARLVRQLLAESLLLAAAGAACGALLAQALSRYLVAFLGTEGDQPFVDMQADWRVLAFAAGLAVLTCILFGLAPAFEGTRGGPGAVLKAGRGLTASRQRFGLRRTLVVAQVALSLVLLVGALLFSRTLGNLLALDAGFRQDGILIADVELTQMPVERWDGFKQDLIARFQAIPGVDSAAETRFVPLGGAATSNRVWQEGSDSRQAREALFNWVGPRYFKTLGIPLLAGRDFDRRDAANSARVAIVSEAFARRLGYAGSPVGQTFRREATPTEPETVFEIVGLVGNSKYRDLREDFQAVAFLAAAQRPSPNSPVQILMHSNAPLPPLISAVRRAIGEANPQVSFDFGVLRTQIREGLMRERLMATLSGFFGLLAAVLAIIGLYGVMSYMVARRGHEIGIRMALGANRRQVVRMILREAAGLLSAGLFAGAILALAVGRAARAMLFGLQPHDPVSFLLAVASLAAVALAASCLPAYRAAGLDPLAALRDE